MGNWQTFSRLTRREQRLVLEAITGLTATWVGLRLLGFRRWRSLLLWTVPRNTEIPTKNDSHSTVTGVLRMEEAAARNLFVTTNCLEQSLVLWWLLRRRGIAADLRIGARKEFDRFEAHAWVEADSAVLNDATAEHRHFVPFDGPITPLEARID